MPDDERSRRRLGDATKSRIADLASGWSVDGADPAAGPTDPAAPDAADTDPAALDAPPAPPDSTSGPRRSKPKTNPPPPPGSPERRALEEKIVATTSRDRLGDATRSRIDELASGWSVAAPSAAPLPTDDPARPASTSGPTRAKPKTNPPPPPGSPERSALEYNIVATTSRDDESTDVLAPDRPRRSTGLQPIAGERLQAPTGAARARTPTGTRPVVGDDRDRPRTPTGARSVVGEDRDRPRTPTGARPVVGEDRDRPRSATGSRPVVGQNLDRPRTPTGSRPVVSGPRPGSSTGSRPIVQPVLPPTRPKLPTGPQLVVGDRSKSPSIPPPSAAALERTRPPSIPPPASTDRSKPESYPPPQSADRSKPESYPPPQSADRSKSESYPPHVSADRGDPTIIPSGDNRSKPTSAAPPQVSADRGDPTIIPSGDDRSKPTSARPPLSSDRSKPTSTPPPADRSHPTSTSPSADRSKPVSVPPPIPSSNRSKPASIPLPAPGSPQRAAPERSKASSIPAKPSGPKYPRANHDSPALAARGANDVDEDTDVEDERRPFATEARTPAVIIDADAFAGNKLPAAAGELDLRVQAPANVASQSVPIGELDHGVDTKQQTAARRDAAEALFKIPDDETPVEDLVEEVDDDSDQDNDASDPHAAHDVHAESERRRSQADAAAHAAEPGTEKFERGDPTDIGAPGPPDVTAIQSPRSRSHLTGGTLRRSAALRRKRGLYGDVRYVFTALFGVRRSRRELVELEHRQEVRTTSRRRHLITAGRAAATMDDFDHPALGRARDTLSLIEEERAKHAGAVAASDAELDRVRRDRATNVKSHADAIATTDVELTEVAKKLEPLEKEASAARKKAAELRDEVQRIERKIADTEALLVSVKGEKLDKAGVQADIATFKANKQAVLRDEPRIAAELDQLNPRMAALEGTRSDLVKKKLELDKADLADQRRTLELLEAIGAKRKVVERASADAETARDNALFELGERLYVDRPKQLTPELSPIDRIDLEIGEDERRAMEIKEILSNIDKAKFARGMAMIILAVGAAGTLVWLVATAT